MLNKVAVAGVGGGVTAALALRLGGWVWPPLPWRFPCSTLLNVLLVQIAGGDAPERGSREHPAVLQTGL